MSATVDDARQALLAKTWKSQQISAERSEILNSGLAANLEMPHPIFIERGQGPYVFDADDNRYIDTSVGFGLHMLGVIKVPLPKDRAISRQLGGPLGALVAGVLIGLVVTPCATPVLVSILAYVASTGNPIWGGFLFIE